MNRFLYYGLWTILISVALYFGSEWHFELKQQAQTEYNPIPQVMFSIFFSIFIGMLLRLPGMWDKRHVTKWGMDWAKLTVVGLPSLYFTIGILLAFTQIIPSLPLYFIVMKTGYPYIHFVAGIVLGYVILDSMRVLKR